LAGLKPDAWLEGAGPRCGQQARLAAAEGDQLVAGAGGAWQPNWVGEQPRPAAGGDHQRGERQQDRRQARRDRPGSLVYELLTGHPERKPGELVFVADLTLELRAWPQDTWAKLGVDPEQVAQAVVDCWGDSEVSGLQVDDLGFEEARSLTRPAMTYARGQLRGRLTARLARAHRRWLHPTSGRQPGDRFP
jgi:hypothetical protein